ncbi:WD40 repeat-like protein [Pseudovirgaria hyperparasitica]|uniref:WD40 repeat-like protein n=1 Tax=Pseudovirgaria hyperparasitica TaxID=470096 RepID=A0A6A6W153_9PEZI|nr:WD40 repeat-like protein [Pseudovirgaria hyperparasitica]KAF2755859.1 WD40 repeat-like protein [Pseudovirgaria hyperparasitica]
MDENEITDTDDQALRSFLPTSFGKQSKKTNVQAQIEQSKRNVAPEPKKLVAAGYDSDSEEGKKDTGSSDDNGDSSDEDEDEDDEFPVSHEMKLKTHESAVTTITLDASGARMVTGSKDCSLKFHDFSSMTPTTIRAFKSVDPAATKLKSNAEAHPIYQASFSPLSSNQILVITASPQAKVFSRDGELQCEFAKGDMYLRDMNNTKGHVSEVTSGAWHPTNRDLCVTAGTDSTLRIWDVNNKRAQRDVIVHKSQLPGSGGRTRMTAVSWGSPMQGGPNVLVAAAYDGSLVMWSGEGPYSRPAGVIRDAHEKDTWTGGLDISADGRLIITRGGDDTIKLWDTRKFKAPVNTVSHKSTSLEFPTSNIRFSPNSSSVLVGSETGHLHILNPATLRPELVTPITPGSPLVTVLWHERLNQIITGSANAEAHVLYNPNTSTSGAKMVMSKAPKKRHVDDDPSLTMDLSQGISNDAIVTPGGILTGSGQPSTSFAARHPQLGLTASGKSRDPRRPHIPATTPFSKNAPDARHIRDSIPLSSMRDEDPREALLRYADKAKNDPLFTNAWKTTQPKTLYADLSDEDEEGGPEAKKIKR